MAVRVSQDPHYSSSNCFEVEMKQKQKKKKRSIPVTKIYEKMGKKEKENQTQLVTAVTFRNVCQSNCFSATAQTLM